MKDSPKSIGYNQLLMSKIRSILKDSDSQWSLLTENHKKERIVKNARYNALL